MKQISRSRQQHHLSRQRQQLTQFVTSDHDQSDLEQQPTHPNSIGRSNQNANRTSTTVFDTIAPTSIEEKHRIVHSSSHQSSVLVRPQTSLEKRSAISDDLTPLTVALSNTTPLTALTYSNTKQTESISVQLDLSEISGMDTLDSLPSSDTHEQLLSLDRPISSSHSNRMYDTDTSMRSVVFSRNNSLEQDLTHQKHVSCLTILDEGNGDGTKVPSSATISTPVNTSQQSANRWNWPDMIGKWRVAIVGSALGLIVGLVIVGLLI